MEKMKKTFVRPCLTVILLSGALLIAAAWLLRTESASLSDADIQSCCEANYPILLQSMKESPQSYGLTREDLEHVKLLHPVRFITASTSEAMLKERKALNVLYFPMVNESGSIIALFSVIKTDSGTAANMGVDFAPILESARKAGAESVCLVQDQDNRIFAVTRDDRVFFMDGMSKGALNRTADGVSAGASVTTLPGHLNQEDLEGAPFVYLDLNLDLNLDLESD